MATGLGHIFAGLRHEIGNPVNAIKLALTVLLEKLGSIDEAKIRRLTERSLSDVGRVERLLERLSAFNVFGDLAPAEVDVGACVAELVRLTAMDLRKRGVALSVTLPREPARALVDERATQQVLLALLDNALNALDEARAPRVLVEVGVDAHEVILRLSDNGCGIPEALLETVFLPLFSTKAGGSGLGLAIARGLLTRMNGTITLESREGAGTVASIRLPRVVPGNDPGSPGSGRGPEPAGGGTS
jgi:signal transduction histidine kinase